MKKIYRVELRGDEGDFRFGDTYISYDEQYGLYSTREKAIMKAKKVLEEDIIRIRRFDNDELKTIEEVCELLESFESVVYYDSKSKLWGDVRIIKVIEEILDEDI